MADKSESEFAAALAKARATVPVGAEYAHYKHPDLTYVIRDHFIWEETEEPAVSYQANYGEKIAFGRKLSVFLEEVEYEGKTIPRFTRVK